MKTNRKHAPALAKGQLWKMDHTEIHIVDLGKRLVHYRMTGQAGQMRRTQTSGIDTMEDYLLSHAARVVKPGALN